MATKSSNKTQAEWYAKKVWSLKPDTDMVNDCRKLVNGLPENEQPVNIKAVFAIALKKAINNTGDINREDVPVNDGLREENQRLKQQANALSSRIQDVYIWAEKAANLLEIEDSGSLPEALQHVYEQVNFLVNLNKELVNENFKLKEELNSLSGYRIRVVYDIRQNPDFIKLKDELEIVLPKLFNRTDIERVPISDDEMVGLIVDYCRRDPSNEFPFKERATVIFKNFINQKSHESQGKETEGTAGLGSETESNPGSQGAGNETTGRAVAEGGNGDGAGTSGAAGDGAGGDERGPGGIL